MEDEGKVTPMMAQYRAMKAQNADKVLFFRLGDFYEMFDDDAVEVSQLLNLTLTHRAGRPMCGIPFHAAKAYIRRLLDLGKKIAICEQLDLSDDPKKLAKREVVQIVSPATVVDDDFLDARASSYVLAVCSVPGKRYAVAYADITSGEFDMTTAARDAGGAALRALLEQVRPREILVSDDEWFGNPDFQSYIQPFRAMVTKLPAYSFSQKSGYAALKEAMGTENLKAFGFESKDPELGAGGALLSYLKDAAKGSLDQIRTIRKVEGSRYLSIDEASRRNLELVANTQDGGERFTLFSAIDRTVTSGGTRLLKQWISFPLVESADIMARQKWVTRWVEKREEAQGIRKILREALDLQRLTSRVAMHRSYPQDLVGIQRTVACFFRLMESGEYGDLLPTDATQEALNSLLSVMTEISKGINENSQGPFKEGEVIVDGYDRELDSLRSAKGNGSGLLEEYLAKVRAETGITNLKLSSNKIIGHYLEVSKGQVDKVPASFYRKQTLVGAERYTTDELAELETRILKSGMAAESREKEVYQSILQATEGQEQMLLSIASFLSTVDVLTSLAETAVQNRYAKPVFTDEDILDIKGGRHPVVEEQLGEGRFVKNPLSIGADERRFCLITGPNMAGKSTYLRQNALIVLLAQIGSWVPADAATLHPVDRLYCRVGASDNLARGESTFLVEMQEAALILRTATRRSLVIIDELGRGTSSQDGLAIAWAVMKELVAMGPKTLFATHYHELTELVGNEVQKLTLRVVEEKGKVVFLRTVIPGVAESSYGLNVARLAGIPYGVVREAQVFQNKHDDEYLMRQTQPSLFAPPEPDEGTREEIAAYDKICDILDHFDVDTSTPMDALSLVSDLKKVLSKARTKKNGQNETLKE